MKLTFLGATRTVTGSKYLVEHGGFRGLVDCGLFQGLKELRLRNREPFPIDQTSLNGVVLTHAHVDHSGYLPLLIKQGFKGPIYSTAATMALCQILLPDSGKIQEEEAEYANQKGYSKHHPALPLYTQKDAEWSLRQFQAVPWNKPFSLAPDLSFIFQPAGHILGAAMVTFVGQNKRVLFSGDLGRAIHPVFAPPQSGHEVDYLVLESTYGARIHPKIDLMAQLAEVISRTIARAGVVLIPAFSVGRTQTLLHCLSELKKAKRIPDVPLYLNSPMSAQATRILSEYPEETHLTSDQITALSQVAQAVGDQNESEALNKRKGPMIILSASGMATGGRILHHLRAFGPDAKNTVLFTGFQAEGTRGAQLVEGKPEVRIHGQMIPIRAEVVNLDAFSAHSDAGETLFWLSQFKRPPKKIFLTHGEKSSAETLKGHIENKLGIPCEIPTYLQCIDLDRLGDE